MHVAMSSPWKKQPEDVVDSVLKRAEVSKVRSGIPTDRPPLDPIPSPSPSSQVVSPCWDCSKGDGFANYLFFPSS